VEVRFKSNTLQAEFEDYRKAERSYGKEVARKYIQRINIIKQAANLSELMHLPGLRCHPLKGTRTGQFAILLTYRYRLIISVSGNSLEIAQIEEVSKHYGD